MPRQCAKALPLSRDKEMQGLMEDSALVIIDFGKAIENGYVKLTESMMAIQSASEGEAEGAEDDEAH